MKHWDCKTKPLISISQNGYRTAYAVNSLLCLGYWINSWVSLLHRSQVSGTCTSLFVTQKHSSPWPSLITRGLAWNPTQMGCRSLRMTQFLSPTMMNQAELLIWMAGISAWQGCRFLTAMLSELLQTPDSHPPTEQDQTSPRQHTWRFSPTHPCIFFLKKKKFSFSIRSILVIWTVFAKHIHSLL